MLLVFTNGRGECAKGLAGQSKKSLSRCLNLTHTTAFIRNVKTGRIYLRLFC